MKSYTLRGKRFQRKKAMDALREGKHVPNSSEKKVLRRIMSETGLSEEEIRKVKKYRVELSQAQQAPSVDKYERVKRNVLKECTQELKLAKEHPKVESLFYEKFGKYIKKNPDMLQIFLSEKDMSLGVERKLLLEKNKNYILEGILQRW